MLNMGHTKYNLYTRYSIVSTLYYLINLIYIKYINLLIYIYVIKKNKSRTSRMWLRMRGAGHAEDDSSVLLWIADRHVSGATSSI